MRFRTADVSHAGIRRVAVRGDAASGAIVVADDEACPQIAPASATRPAVVRAVHQGPAAGTLGWKDLVSLQAAELRRRGMACILLWMQGGPSHFETFSPKPEHANGGETKAISTSVPGIEIADSFPHMA